MISIADNVHTSQGVVWMLNSWGSRVKFYHFNFKLKRVQVEENENRVNTTLHYTDNYFQYTPHLFVHKWISEKHHNCRTCGGWESDRAKKEINMKSCLYVKLHKSQKLLGGKYSVPRDRVVVHCAEMLANLSVQESGEWSATKPSAVIL